MEEDNLLFSIIIEYCLTTCMNYFHIEYKRMELHDTTHEMDSFLKSSNNIVNEVIQDREENFFFWQPKCSIAKE